MSLRATASARLMRRSARRAALIDSLPTDLLASIVHFLTEEDQFQFASVCRAALCAAGRSVGSFRPSIFLAALCALRGGSVGWTRPTQNSLKTEPMGRSGGDANINSKHLQASKHYHTA